MKEKKRQPNIFTLFVRNITLPFGIKSAIVPTNGARRTFVTVKKA